MNKLYINRTYIKQNKIDQLSIEKKTDDIMSYIDKFKDFFSKNKEKTALNLIYDIYYNPNVSLLEKLDKYNKLKDITGDNYKHSFGLSFYDKKITFYIFNKEKATFSLDKIIDSIVMDRVEKNNGIQYDFSTEEISKHIIKNIKNKKIIKYDSKLCDVIKYINEEYFNLITDKVNDEKKHNFKNIRYENINYIFKEYENIDTIQCLKDLFSNKEESSISIGEKIKTFNLLKGIAKDEYQKFFSLNIDNNNEITLSIGKLIIKSDFDDFINEMKELTEHEYNKNRLIENKITLNDTINEEIKNKTLLLETLENFEKQHFENINNLKYTSIYEKNINLIQVTKNEITERLLTKEIENSELNYKEINKILHNIGGIGENYTIFINYLIDKKEASDNLKIEIIKFLLSKIDSSGLGKTNIIIDDTSIKLIIYGKNNENVELVNFKTKNNYSFLNDIDNDSFRFGINITDKLLILSEIIRKSNSSKVFELDNDLIANFILKAVNNKKLFISYVNGLIDDVKCTYKLNEDKTLLKENNIILKDKFIKYISNLFNDKLNRYMMEQTELKFLYSVISNKSHPYYSELKNIADTYNKLIEKSNDKKLVANNYISLFFNDNNLTDIEKIKYFENLKLDLNENILDFNINDDTIDFFIKKDSNNGLEENINSKIISTNVKLSDEIYDKLKSSDRQDKATLLKKIIEIDKKNKTILADEKKQNEFIEKLNKYVKSDLYENLYEDFLKVNESPSDSEKIEFIYSIMNNLEIYTLVNKETRIQVDHSSLTLKVKPNSVGKIIDLIKIKTNKDLSHLNNLSTFYNGKNKLDIILELEKPSNNIELNEDLMVTYLSDNYSNKSLYNNYNKLTNDYIDKNKSYYKEEIFSKSGIDINNINYDIDNDEVDQRRKFHPIIVENIEYHSEESAIDVNNKINQLRFIYSVINDENNKHYEVLTTLKNNYLRLKKEYNLNIEPEEFVSLLEKEEFHDLFFNNKISLKEKLNAFNDLEKKLAKDNQFI